MVNRRLTPVVLFAAALLLLTIGVVSADLKPTYVLNSWDDVQGRYENGNLVLTANEQWHPFYTRLDFDTDIHPGACGGDSSSRWAGDTFVGLYNTDTSGAPGFQQTRNWALVKCSAFDDPALKFIDFDPAAGQVLAQCTSGTPDGSACVLIPPQDDPVACTTGNCSLEIKTNFHVTIDTNCDTAIDDPFIDPFAADGVCLYWEGLKPPPSTPDWSGNIQVRYFAASDPHGGDKTINFSVEQPTAVSVSQLKAVAAANLGSLAAWAGALFLGVAAVIIWRRKS